MRQTTMSMLVPVTDSLRHSPGGREDQVRGGQRLQHADLHRSLGRDSLGRPEPGQPSTFVNRALPEGQGRNRCHDLDSHVAFLFSDQEVEMTGGAPMGLRSGGSDQDHLCDVWVTFG